MFAKCALGVLLLLAVLSWVGFKLREILLIFLEAAAGALVIWYLKNRWERLEEKLDLLLKEMRKAEKD